MSLAHGTRIAALGIALLAVAGWGAGGVAAMPDVADARVASTTAELPPFNFEIRTLSNRADLLSDGDALVDVQVPKTVPMKKVTLTLNGVDVGDRFVADENTRTLRGVLTGMAPGENTLVADSNGNGNGRPWAASRSPTTCAEAPSCSARRRSPGSAPRRRRCLPRATRRRPTPAACRPSRWTRSATSPPSTSCSIARRQPAARQRCPIPARPPRRRPTTASSPSLHTQRYAVFFVLVFAVSLRGKGYSTGAYCSDFGGTSSATPLVAGVAALVLSANRSLRWDEVRDVLTSTADKIDPLGRQRHRSGHSLKYGCLAGSMPKRP